MRLSEEMLHRPAYPHHCIHKTLVDYNPPSPQKTSVYSLKQENHYSVYSLKNWQNWKKIDFIVLDWYSQCVCAEYSWIHMECMHMLLFGNTCISPLRHIWIVFKYVLRNFGFCVTAGVRLSCAWLWSEALYYRSECTGIILLPDHQKTLSSPAHFVRLSWLCIVQWQWEMGWYIPLCPE